MYPGPARTRMSVGNPRFRGSKRSPSIPKARWERWGWARPTRPYPLLWGGEGSLGKGSGGFAHPTFPNGFRLSMCPPGLSGSSAPKQIGHKHTLGALRAYDTYVKAPILHMASPIWTPESEDFQPALGGGTPPSQIGQHLVMCRWRGECRQLHSATRKRVLHRRVLGAKIPESILGGRKGHLPPRNPLEKIGGEASCLF